jgi:phosphate transport system ATP-binding protein
VFLLGEDRVGELVESGATDELFNEPKNPRTRDYVAGRVG